MNGYVVCAKCGARIRADREWCLRCEAPLVPARSSELQLPAWLRARGGGTLIFGAVGVLALLLVGYTIWERSASSDGDAGTRAASPSGANAASGPGSPSTGAAAPTVTLWSATSLDARKKGGAELSGAELATARARDEATLTTRPDDPETLNNLGLTLERIGDIDGAIARFSRAAQIGPRNWAYHFNLAHALAQRQSWDRAIGEYRIAAGLYPTDGATQCNLATALQKKGDDAAAIPVFERAVQLAPAEPTCHLALATSLEKEGRDADARREYQQYLELAPSAPDADAVKSHLASLGAGRS
jgi:Flp pilus assembly protein TadD